MEIASRIASYELAFRMQTAAPELLDFSKESPAHAARCTASTTRRRKQFATNCLLARRMVERGVRFVLHDARQLGPAHQPQPRAEEATATCDRPADRGSDQGPEAARPARLHARRLGRRIRPHADGRDPQHAQTPTTPAAIITRWPTRMWLAGGGIKGGHGGRQDRRPRLQHRRRTRSTSTTCRRPCCTASASTTPG